MNAGPTPTLSGNDGSATLVSELLVSGMSCNTCARHVSEAIQNVPGVRSASVLLEAGRASVRWVAGSTANLPAVVAAVERAGYEATPVEQAAAHHHRAREG